MSKQITATELAEIITKLLTDPKEIEEASVFSAFMTSAAKLVCDYCGGRVLHPADNWPNKTWMVGIHGNECSPEDGGIWANYDKEGDLWC